MTACHANMRWLLVLAFLASVAMPVIAMPVEQPGSPDARQVKAVAEGCLANREAFAFLTCKFTFRRGKAQSIESALRGEFLQPDSVVVGKVRWMVDGDRVLYELTTDPKIFQEAEAQARKEGAMRFSTPLTSETNLTDGRWKLAYGSSMRSANIIRPERPGWDINISPFSMNMMGPNEAFGPGNMLRGCLSGKFFCHSLSTEQVDGLSTVVATIGETNESVRKKYWLDPERGFLPIRAASFSASGEELRRGYWTDLRKSSGARWFPWRAVAISKPESHAAEIAVEEIRVSSLDVDKRPPHEAFHVMIPKGTSVSYPGTSLAFFGTKTDERVGLDDIPKLHQRCLDSIPFWEARNARGRDPAAEGANRRWPFGIITASAAGLFLIIGGGAWYYRRRTVRHAAAPTG